MPEVQSHGIRTYVREDMGSYPFELWARADHEIAAAYAKAGSPSRPCPAWTLPCRCYICMLSRKTQDT
jgi:hypothetical protein